MDSFGAIIENILNRLEIILFHTFRAISVVWHVDCIGKFLCRISDRFLCAIKFKNIIAVHTIVS